MITIEKQDLILNLTIDALGTETVSLEVALGRVLRENVYADMDMPPFRKSSVDGYACRATDLNNELEIAETIQAGMWPTKILGENLASKIMTGAPLPEGADFIFMVEDSEILANGKVKCSKPVGKDNICLQGEDFLKNDILIQSGTILKAQHLSIMAGVGHISVTVSRIPKVGILATGTELVEADKMPARGQIRNSNSWQLKALLQQINIQPTYLGTLPDEPEIIENTISDAIQKFDVLIITGGASVGDFDFIPQILKKLHANTLMERTGIQPGNPMTFNIIGNKYVFGLSGNPVSSFIQFLVFTEPFLYKLIAANYKEPYTTAKMKNDFIRKKTERIRFFPVTINTNHEVEVISYNGSAHLAAYAAANAILAVPKGTSKISEGEYAYVRPL